MFCFSIKLFVDTPCRSHWPSEWLKVFMQRCSPTKQSHSVTSGLVWTCRSSAQSGPAVVWDQSWGSYTSLDVIPFNLWLPGVLWLAWRHWRRPLGCSLPGHLHCPPGSINSFFVSMFCAGAENMTTSLVMGTSLWSMGLFWFSLVRQHACFSIQWLT